MTQDGSPYDNAIAERVNGILKREWLNDEDFAGLQDVREKVDKIVYLYNNRRPHLAIGFNTPENIYQQKRNEFTMRVF